jgi:DNA-binding transcriptional regulator YiaG
LNHLFTSLRRFFQFFSIDRVPEFSNNQQRQPYTGTRMILADPNSLRRPEIKAAFRRHPGSKAQLARELGIHRQNISDWMSGRGRSERVDRAIRQRAAELINQERAEAENK